MEGLPFARRRSATHVQVATDTPAEFKRARIQEKHQIVEVIEKTNIIAFKRRIRERRRVGGSSGVFFGE